MAIRLTALLFACVCMTLVSGCEDPPVGSKQRPFTMYFVPSLDAGKIATNADDLIEFVEKRVSQKLYGKDTGFYAKGSIPTSYIALIEALGTGKADFGAFNTFSYVLAKDIKKYDVEAVLKVVRGEGEVSYKAQIIAHVDSGIDKLEDLQGKKFAYTDPASTAGFIMPAQLFDEKNIELGQTVFAQKHDNVVTMVYQKQVDAGATFYSPPAYKEVDGEKVEVIRDARHLVKTQFPDVAKKVKIVDFTTEIPNAPWVIRGTLLSDKEQNTKLKNAVVESLLEYAETDEGKKAIDHIQDLTGFQRTTDAEYAGLRTALTTAKLDLEDVLAQKAKKKK